MNTVDSESLNEPTNASDYLMNYKTCSLENCNLVFVNILGRILILFIECTKYEMWVGLSLIDSVTFI
jgi:hypothetical protein